MAKTRRYATDPFIWEIIHWITMALLGFRIVRGYAMLDPDPDTGALKYGPLVHIYLDPARNWSSEGDDWHRLDVPYPTPIWTARWWGKDRV